MQLRLKTKPFSFKLNKKLRTSQGLIEKKHGWLLHLANNSDNCGWGEVAPLDHLNLKECDYAIKKLGENLSRDQLEESISSFPPALAFGIGAALEELDYLIRNKNNYNWLKAPDSAILLSPGENLLSEIDNYTRIFKATNSPFTLKWKVGVKSNIEEEKLLAKILEKMPSNAHLRLDANGGWNRRQANNWINYFHQDQRLQWLEQPLPAKDFEGLVELSKQIPIALDESLYLNPSLRNEWKGWQIRRPLLEGDPRILLKELNQKIGHRVISTAFETGIGRRWINHLAALQQNGPTPTAPGLAPGWCPNSALFSNDPEVVWEAA